MSGSSAQLRILQTSPDMSGFDVRLDDHAFFSTGGGLAFKPVSSGSHALQITAASAGTIASIPDSIGIPATFAATSTLTRPATNFSLCWTPAGATNPLSGGPRCGIVETIVVGGKFPVNSTFVLADPPIDPSAPPGTFGFVHFDVLGN